MDHQAIPQIDVASLESRRGNRVRSVILEVYDDHNLGVYFRDHDLARWAEALILAADRAEGMRP